MRQCDSVITFPNATRSQYVGEPIYIHGISPVGADNSLLGSSGIYVVPASPNAPPAPASITAMASADQSSIQIDWTASSGATSYTLQQAVDGGTWTAVKSGTGLTYTAAQPADGDYVYRVRACKDADCSLWTVSSKVSIGYVPPTPASITT